MGQAGAHVAPASVRRSGVGWLVGLRIGWHRGRRAGTPQPSLPGTLADHSWQISYTGGQAHQPAATALAVPTILALNMTEHQNWQGTKVASEKPMTLRMVGSGTLECGFCGGCWAEGTHAWVLGGGHPREPTVGRQSSRCTRRRWRQQRRHLAAPAAQQAHMRQMMKPAAFVMEAMANVAAEHSSCSTPWP